MITLALFALLLPLSFYLGRRLETAEQKATSLLAESNCAVAQQALYTVRFVVNNTPGASFTPELRLIGEITFKAVKSIKDVP